ncbi:hypothetical protein F895_02619 [Acinetobacter sp. CIP 64.2]|uniref:hypothetical protein n=1 Tax=Acinetobacter sp. CIP 64.2 TaxID=1217694 RepID=UPI000288237E|nr:hypothetical protein [Acinetobacter sp. CIP 64.2]ENX13315.1 hypothetical protein F895_02619 [Acinetobacter sp. CIP 64.2]
MLKDITVVDYQGSEKKAQANYSEAILLQSGKVKSPQVEYILIKGEIIYPTLDWIFNSSDGNSYYIQ